MEAERRDAAPETGEDVRAAELSARRITNRLLAVIVFIAVAWALRAADAVAVPLFISFFLTVLLLPVHKLFAHLRVPNAISIVAILAILGGSVFVVGSIVAAEVDALAARVPEFEAGIEDMLGRLQWVFKTAGVKRPVLTKDQLVDFLRGSDLMRSGVGVLADLVTNLLTILFYMVFLLAEAALIYERMERAGAEGSRVITVYRKISGQMQRYLLAKTAMALLNAVLWVVFLAAMNVEYPLLFGVLVFMFYYVPHVGSLLAVGPPVLLTALTGPEDRWLVVLVGLMVISNVVGNIIEPRFLGWRLRLSPFFVLVSLFFFGWLWGVIGVVLAVPIAATLRIVCAEFDSLRFFGLLIGGDVPRLPTRRLRRV